MNKAIAIYKLFGDTLVLLLPVFLVVVTWQLLVTTNPATSTHHIESQTGISQAQLDTDVANGALRVLPGTKR
jgi:hypothetical protein